MPSTQPPGTFQPFTVRVMASREKVSLPVGTRGGNSFEFWATTAAPLLEVLDGVELEEDGVEVEDNSWISSRLAFRLRRRAEVSTERIEISIQMFYNLCFMSLSYY